MHRFIHIFKMTRDQVAIFTFALIAWLYPQSAFAQTTANTFFTDLIDNITTIPGFISMLMYLTGILLAIAGIFKLKETSDAPDRVPFRDGIVRLAAGGAVIALPTIVSTIAGTIGQNTTLESDSLGFEGQSGVASSATSINDFFIEIITNLDTAPVFITTLMFVAGIILAIAGIFKLKESSDSPDRTPFKQGIIRLVIGGGLIAIPTIASTMAGTVGYTPGDCSGNEMANPIHCLIEEIRNSPSTYNPQYANADSFGQAITNVFIVFTNYPWFLTSISFLIGIIIAILMLFDLREYIDNPKDKPLYQIVMKFFAGAFFFALPTLALVLQDTISGGSTGWTITAPPDPTLSDPGADRSLVEFVKDVDDPMNAGIAIFSFIAGLTLTFIGIRRLINAANEGAQAPLGRGTVTTFFIAAIMFSLFYFMKTINGSIFGIDEVVYVGVDHSAMGISAASADHMNAIIWAVLTFMQIIGFISIIRGLFIFRAIGEGAGNASPMAGFTHIIGGALAINLGAIVALAVNTFALGTGLGICTRTGGAIGIVGTC